MIVYSKVYSGADQRKYQSSASLAFVQGIHRTNGQLRGKCLMTSSCSWIIWEIISYESAKNDYITATTQSKTRPCVYLIILHKLWFMFHPCLRCAMGNILLYSHRLICQADKNKHDDGFTAASLWISYIVVTFRFLDRDERDNYHRAYGFSLQFFVVKHCAMQFWQAVYKYTVLYSFRDSILAKAF